jgi:hypothetical protein
MSSEYFAEDKRKRSQRNAYYYGRTAEPIQHKTLDIGEVDDERLM